MSSVKRCFKHPHTNVTQCTVCCAATPWTQQSNQRTSGERLHLLAEPSRTRVFSVQLILSCVLTDDDKSLVYSGGLKRGGERQASQVNLSEREREREKRTSLLFSINLLLLGKHSLRETAFVTFGRRRISSLKLWPEQEREPPADGGLSVRRFTAILPTIVS